MSLRAEEAAPACADVAGRRERTVLVLGPAPASQGGVAGVLAVLLESWAVPGYRPRMLATYVDGSKARKLAVAARAAAAVLGACATGRCDVLHVHFAARASFHRKALFALTAGLFGVPVVGHAHSGLFPGFYERAGRLHRAYIRFMLNRFDRLVVLSPEWVGFYRPLYRRGEPVVVHNPVHVPAEPDPRPAGRPVLLSLGRLGRGKGTYDLLEAMPAILERHPDAELWLGGDGDVEAVRRLLRERPWGGRVRLLGWVSGAEKDAVLAAASVFLLPSYAEGLPMAVLEAMARGLPVVATPVGGIPHLIADGETGVLVPPGRPAALAAAVLGLLDAPDQAAAMGRAARAAVAERCAAPVVQARLAALYDGMTRNGERERRG